MREIAGNAAAPAVRARNRRRGSFVALTLSGWPCRLAWIRRRCVRRPFDTIGGVSALVLRRLLLLTSPSFVLPAVLDKITPVAAIRGRGRGVSYWPFTSVSSFSAFPVLEKADVAA